MDKVTIHLNRWREADLSVEDAVVAFNELAEFLVGRKEELASEKSLTFGTTCVNAYPFIIFHNLRELPAKKMLEDPKLDIGRK